VDAASDSRSYANVVLAVVLAGAAAMVGVRLALNRGRRRTARRGHDAIPAWVEVARGLREGAEIGPEILALALAGYDLDLGLEAPVRARLPAAVASASEAAKLSLDEVQRAVVRRAATDEGAREALEELKALAPRLGTLPTVRKVGPLWPDDPGALCEAVRHYTRAIGLVPPSRG
jgi:hypothetical protein